jgi:hypothetical protein
MKTMVFKSEKFAADATAFFKKQPGTVNDLPVVRLLLWLNPQTTNYMWSYLSEPRHSEASEVSSEVLKGMNMLRLVPIGAVLLSFEVRADKRIYLSAETPSFVDERFDLDEVLNGTIPYFMREKFGYRGGRTDVSGKRKRDHK